MKGLDTNVLVRFLLRDDERQASIASNAIGAALERGEPLLVSLLTLLETEWVLRASAALPKGEIVRTFKLLLESRDLIFEHESVVEEALHYFERGRAEFADCLMASQYRNLGCDVMITFDRSAAGLPGVKLLAV
jgi:predicted nucleic-acid-binding protein